MTRTPLALANWKMAMTVAEGLAFARDLQRLAGDLLAHVDVVICPAYTALWPIAQALGGSRLQLGGQNIAPADDLARTGEISAAQLADVGCRWVMLGHWEVRRHLGDDDAAVNRKVHLALAAGLAPVILVGPAREEQGSLADLLGGRLARVLAGCDPAEVGRMAFIYEPELAIGRDAPAAAAEVAGGCALIRGWLRAKLGAEAAEGARIIYGGSVAPEHAGALLAAPDVDGLGAGRQGRDPATFAAIVRQVARVKVRYTT